MLQRTHRITANGLTHFLRDSGAEGAPAAILLHGFPDSSAVWDKVTPRLVEAGFRVLAPDLRGFGETDMAPATVDYDISTGAMRDALGLLAALDLRRVHLVGHDFGAVVAWGLAAEHGDRFQTLAALSVGHPRAYLLAGFEQKIRSLYVVFHQFSGICESVYRLNDWAALRRNLPDSVDKDAVIALLARPGRLTAALNWYRANLNFERLRTRAPIAMAGEGNVAIPTLGVWSSGERYLVEAQMIESARFVRASWTYERIDGASHWIPEDAPDALAALLIRHWRGA